MNGIKFIGSLLITKRTHMPYKGLKIRLPPMHLSFAMHFENDRYNSTKRAITGSNLLRGVF